MKVILWCGIYVALTIYNPATSAAIRTKSVACGKKSASCPQSPATIAHMVAGQSTNRPDCIERRQLISLMDKTTLKERIKLKLKKAVDKAWKAKQAKEKQAKRSRKENEVVKKKSHSKALKPKRQGDAKQKNRPRPVRHADFVLRAHLKNVSEAQLLKAEEEGNDKGVHGNPHCKRLCTWDCDGFRCFRRCVCNRTK